MIDRWIRFVLEQRLLVVIAVFVLVAGGVAAWRQLPIDAFPDVTNVQVMVLTDAKGLTPEDVEQQVTFPIELALQGLPDVRELRSLSKSGLSQVVVVFEDHVDTYFSRQLVFERIQESRAQLPEWAEPRMGPISTGLGEIYQYTLKSETHSLMDLRTIQDWDVAPRLRALAGVNEVNSFGGEVRQFQVSVDPSLLLKYRLTTRDVLEAIRDNNGNAGGNYITDGWEQSYVRSFGLLHGIQDIENIVLEAADGTPVYLKDVAEVAIGPETRQGAVTRDGSGETVAGMVIMLKGENSRIVVDRVKKTIPAIQESLPQGVKIDSFYDRTELIRSCVDTVTGALLQGGGFVILVLFLLMGSFRGALIAAVSLPLAALSTFVLMRTFDVTANLMSLGGLAIAIGMIVDASIIVTENITRHLSTRPEGSHTLETVRTAVAEVARPLIFSILIIIVVLVPLFTLEQMEGKMFKPLALTLCFATISSLAIALTIVPALSSFFLDRRSRRDKPNSENAVVAGLHRIYRPVLSLALRFPKSTIGLAALLFAGTLAMVPSLGTEFLPQLDEGAIAINVVRLPSAALEGSVSVGEFMEKRLAGFPEIRTVVTKTGRAEISEDPMGPEQSDVIIMLQPRSKWPTGRSKQELVEAIEEDLSRIPGLRLAFSQPIALRVNELISGIKSDLAVKIFGPEIDELRDAAERTAAVVRSVEGAEDVSVEQVSGFYQVEIVPDREAMARFKINVATVNDIVETAIGGKVATTLIEGERRFAVLVRYPERYRDDLESIRRILVPAPGGEFVPLERIAQILRGEAPAQISREEGRRRVVVQCNVRERDLGGFVSAVKDRIRPIIDGLPPGYSIEFGGQFENQERAMHRLAVVVPIAVLLIFLFQFSAFGSIRSALLVLANLPFALVGGILAIRLTGIHLSVPAAIGFVALFGMAVQDGTVLVSFFQRLRADGHDVRSAILKACELRFASVLMTTLTTVLGLLPMFYASGSGSEIQAPLATVVMGGLLSALVLVLVVLPTLYAWIENRFPRISQPRDAAFE